MWEYIVLLRLIKALFQVILLSWNVQDIFQIVLIERILGSAKTTSWLKVGAKKNFYSLLPCAKFSFLCVIKINEQYTAYICIVLFVNSSRQIGGKLLLIVLALTPRSICQILFEVTYCWGDDLIAISQSFIRMFSKDHLKG